MKKQQQQQKTKQNKTKKAEKNQNKPRLTCSVTQTSSGIPHDISLEPQNERIWHLWQTSSSSNQLHKHIPKA